MGFEQALEALYAGDCAELSRLLDRDPSLVHARRAGAEVPYNGYFCEPTLLHHVAGNPLIKPLPQTIVGLTEVILHKGAEVDAATRAGPDQPRDIGWSTLGLAATSSTAREAGCQEQLMQRLLDRGADPNFRNGGPLIGAMYYGEGAAAAFLARHGAEVDLIAAAGLGLTERMAAFFSARGKIRPGARTSVHYSQEPRPEPETAEDVIALAFASMGGHLPAIDLLMSHGANVNARPPFDHRATALHWAALRDHGALIRALLDRRADPELRDSSFHGTPLDWAHHNSSESAAAALSAG